MLDDTKIMSNVPLPQSDNRKRDIEDNKDYNIDHALLDVLNKMIPEAFPVERSELKFINHKCQEVTNKLLLKDQEKMSIATTY